MKAQDIINVLLKACSDNGLKVIYSSPVINLILGCKNEIHTVCCNNKEYKTKKLIITTGGCSYPATGSDGSFFSILDSLGINVIPPKPALVPLYVYNYPYKDLAGISFPNAKIKTKFAENTDSLLLTHSCFSGPAILNLSRYASISDMISINYYPNKSKETIIYELKTVLRQSKKQLITDLYTYFNEVLTKSPADMPNRFLEVICNRCCIDPIQRSSQISDSSLKSIIELLINDTFTISSLGGFNVSMVTTGGVSLAEVDLKTLESKKFPNFYFAGEVLDVDGDTGGYNLQFAFSSGHLAANQ